MLLFTGKYPNSADGHGATNGDAIEDQVVPRALVELKLGFPITRLSKRRLVSFV